MLAGPLVSALLGGRLRGTLAGGNRMRYIAAVIVGILVAILPPFVLSLPEYAQQSACVRTDVPTVPNEDAGPVVPMPCWLMHADDQSSTTTVITTAMLLLGCVLSGSLAARIAESRSALVAFAGPSLGYAGLLWMQESNGNLGALIFPIAVAAGLVGVVGSVRWSPVPHLTNAWRAMRAKPRPPQA